MLKNARKLGGQAIVYGLGDALYKAVAFFLIPVYLKHLTPAQYGTMEALLVTGSLGVLLVGMGVPNTVMRFFFRAKTEEEKRIVVGTVTFLSLVISLPFSFILLWQSERLSVWILGTGAYSALFAILAVNIFLASFRRIPLFLFRARGQPVSYTVINSTVALVTLFLNIYFVAYAHLGVLGVMLGNLAGAIIGIVMVLPSLWRNMAFTIDKSSVRPIIAYAVPLGLVAIPDTMIFMADRYFLARMTGLEVLGIYALAYKLANVIKVFVVMPFMLAWTPFVFENYESNRERAAHLFGQMSTVFIIGSLGIVVLLSVFSSDVINLLTDNEQFREAGQLVPVLAFALFFHGTTLLARTGIMVSGRTQILAIISSLSLLLNLVLNALLIGWFGYSGAAYTLLLTFMFSTVLGVVLSRREFLISYEYSRLAHVVIAAIAVIALALILPDDLTMLTQLLMKGSMCLLFVFYIYTMVLGKDERGQLSNLFRVIGRRNES